MSFGSEMLPQISHIKRIVAQECSRTAVVRVSNKSVVSRCEDRASAGALAFLLRSDGWGTQIRKGRKSDSFYVAAYLNHPYY